MLRTHLAQLFSNAIADLIQEGRLPETVRALGIEIADPKNPEHGDFACNFALTASKVAGKNPRELGEMLAAKITGQPGIDAVDIAGPGFINLRLNPSFVASFLTKTSRKDMEAAAKVEKPLSINVEFVSVNPNGPITIGSGRGAAFGSTLTNVLESVGHTVHREYYINDGVNSEQMRIFAESVRAFLMELPIPENGYKADYVQNVANFLGGYRFDGARGASDIHSSLAKASQGERVGQLLADIRHRFESDSSQSIKDLDSQLSIADYQALSQALMIEWQKTTLESFGVTFDTWFSEQSLHDAGAVAQTTESLIAKGIADDKPSRTKLKLAKGGKIEEVISEEQPVDEDDVAGTLPTLWLRSTKLGDDMDRVLRRKDGRPTYITSDVAYHKDKFNRPANADKLITVLGPDHHGYIGRLTAVVAAMLMEQPGTGVAIENELDAQLFSDTAQKEACDRALAIAKESLEVVIFQLVRFVKDGKPAPMRKRDGNIYALIDLMMEIGAKLKPESSEEDQMIAGRDVARFFYVMRHHDTTFDFDLDLAEKQSDENPVFYVQYAHARINSIIERGKRELTSTFNPDSLALLTDDREKNLIKKIVDLPNELKRAAEDYGVHRIATYSIELARAFHSFYDGCKVVQPEQPELSSARIRLCEVTKDTLAYTLNEILGVSAPDSMHREPLLAESV